MMFTGNRLRKNCSADSVHWIMMVVNSTGSHFISYEPLIKMIAVQGNRFMTRDLNQYPMVFNMHYQQIRKKCRL